MKTKKKKLIKLESELKVYNKIAVKIARVLDTKLSIKDLDDYIFLKIRKIENEIDDIDLLDEPEEPKESAPNYGPGDEVFYEGVKCTIMAVSHKDKTYDLKSSTDRAWVKWDLIK